MLDEDLRKWLNQKWVRINTSGNIEGPCGTSKRKSNPNRCLPLSKAKSLSKSQRKSTAVKKKKAGRTGKQFVKNTKSARVTNESVDILIQEYIGNELQVLKSFEFKNELSADIFSDGKMIPEIRENLLDIAQQFVDSLEIKIDIEDIVLTGSISNYNWSKYSDIDLHLIVDYSKLKKDKELLERYFYLKKSIWNSTYPIKVKNFDVELYVEDINDLTVASGQYSVKDDKWIKEPKNIRTAHIDMGEPCIERGGNSTVHRGILAQYLDTNLPNKIDLCHSCGNGKCSNPKHLYWGTRSENVSDSQKHGTWSNPLERMIAKYGSEETYSMLRRRSQKMKGNNLGAGNKGKHKSEAHKKNISNTILSKRKI